MNISAKSLAIRVIFLSTFLLWITTLNAQKVTRFDDQLKYVSQLEELTKSHLADADKQLYKNLGEYWSNDSISFSSPQKERILEVSNQLLKKTVVNTSHFISLAKILMLYPDTPKVQEVFDAWLEGLASLTTNDKVSIAKTARFIDNSLLFFTQNILSVSPAFKWKTNSGNFSVHYTDEFYFSFDDIDLTCFNDKKDSITILKTSGKLYPLEDKWSGNGGKVTWARSGFPEDEIFAQLSFYNINLTRNEYEADSVLFTNTDYFDAPTLGRLKDKVANMSRPEMMVYPEFHSYTQRHKITNFFKDVDYDGGYYMTGSQFVGKGSRENPAIIEIKRKNEDFLRVEATTYIFRRQTVMSNYAQVRFLMDSDSLFHTGLNFSYNDNDRLVTVSPTDFLATQSPILSSYHNFSIKFGQIQWKLDSDVLTFGAPIGSSLGRAFFESNNYFSEEEFDMLMGRDDQHPLFAVANFTNRIKSKQFLVNEFANFIRKPVEQTRAEVLRLAMLGYLLYESETGHIQVLSKLYDAIRARGKFIDYDVLKFNSTTEGTPNVTMDLNTFEMAIKGVNNVSVSDSQNVFLYPARKELILKKDRNFAFDGVVEAGLFTFYGNDFNFDYENFRLDLSSIDSLSLDYQTEEYDFYGKRALKQVTSTIENITGEIQIDQPNNKSGLQYNEDFPIFRSTRSSFVYYDDKSIHNGVYPKESFYFEIYPFVFKNINNFEYKDMNFIGMFYSADIFGPIEDTLVLRPDNSLGFRRTSPSGGYAVYEGRGRFYNRIDLSNQGLRGMGDLKYITATIGSDNLYFFPDSMRTVSKDFHIQQQTQGIQFPEVVGSEHLVKWHPFQEKLYAYKGKKPFNMFHEQAQLTGDLVLQPLGLEGKGLMDMNKARLKSSLYEYNAMDYHSKIAQVEFDITTTNELALTADKMKVWIDFVSREGQFNKIGSSLLVDMPPMMYRSYLDGFIWAMDHNELTISSPSVQDAVEMERFYVSNMADRDTIPVGSIFYSHHQEEDSLYFVSPKARYDLSHPNIKADSVDYVIIADAIVNPKDKKVEIDAKKRFMPLSSSVITANYTQRYHTIYNAKVNIEGRSRYYASGTIDYVDENDSIQSVFLKEIKVDRDGNTFAGGVLSVPDSFKLSPRFGFVGSFDVSAKEQFWFFNGGAQPLHSCPEIRSTNVTFEARLNPKELYIPFAQNPRNLNLVNLMSGSIITVDSIHLYPGFVTPRKEHTDRALVDAHGYMYYNKVRNRFLIGEKPKINNPDSLGNLISLSTDFCMLSSEGKVNLPVNLGQIHEYTTGLLNHNVSDSILNMDVVMGLKFHFNDQSLEALSNEIAQTSGLTGVDLNRRPYLNYLRERLDPSEAQKGIHQIRLFGVLTQIPSALESTITFADLKMRWDPKYKSFVSRGKLGIGTIGGVQVNKKVDGFIEIYKSNTGDRMIMYLELAKDKYYVFHYARGSMQVSSHNPLFTEPINKMKTRERRVKVKAGQIPFNFVVGTRRELDRARLRYDELMGRTSDDTEIIEYEESDTIPYEEGAVDIDAEMLDEETDGTDTIDEEDGS